MTENKLSEIQQKDLIQLLKERFENNMHRHKSVAWNDVEKKLSKKILWSLNEMEKTGGEPDIVVFDEQSGDYYFVDCSLESPKLRRSFCYDRQALNSRKENKPKNNVIDLVEEMGVELLSEDQYRSLQKLDEFDLKTSSWIKTPETIRKLGGALFCDRRYDTVFTYHNGAESYYAARGFRVLLRV